MRLKLLKKGIRQEVKKKRIRQKIISLNNQLLKINETNRSTTYHYKMTIVNIFYTVHYLFFFFDKA